MLPLPPKLVEVLAFENGKQLSFETGEHGYEFGLQSNGRVKMFLSAFRTTSEPLLLKLGMKRSILSKANKAAGWSPWAEVLHRKGR